MILLLKYTCVEFTSIKGLWKSQIKNFTTNCKGIGGSKKKQKISKSKTTTLEFFDNLKNRQQYQGSENWCYTESFMLLTISNLRTTAFCFENIDLLK